MAASRRGAPFALHVLVARVHQLNSDDARYQYYVPQGIPQSPSSCLEDQQVV